MTCPQTIQEICSSLAEGDRPELARRIAYLASQEDLEEGEAPVTLESALGFWEFFRLVESEGKVDLACSPEGCISAVWRFPDERRACVWFLNSGKVRVAAMNGQGRFIDTEEGSDADSGKAVAEKLVEAGLLAWRSEVPKDKNSHQGTTLPGTAGAAI